MSSPAYYLRPNKAIDRFLFIDLLRRLDGSLPRRIADYEYISLAGPYLEDSNLVHSAFGNRRMMSLEGNSRIVDLQKLNRPHSAIRLKCLTTAEFIEGYVQPARPQIIWLDYTRPEWPAQLEEVCELIPQVPPMSIVRVTLAGATSSLGGDCRNPLPQRAAKMGTLFSDYGPFTQDDIRSTAICDTLYRLSRRAIADSIEDTEELSVRTLAAYKYDDGTPILTFTLMVGPPDKIDALIKSSQLKRWPFAALSWALPKRIQVPYLSVRERLAVDRMLPKASAKRIVSKLKLELENELEDSVSAIESYVEFYRHVPHFIRASL